MKILIVDDETNIQKTTAMALKTMGHKSLAAYSGKQALKKLDEDKVNAIFLDLKLGTENGLEVYEQIRAEGHEMPVIMFTAYSSIETAIEATRKGVFDYVTKPFVPEQIRQLLKKIEENNSLNNKVVRLESQLADSNPTLTFSSSDPIVHEIYEVAKRAANSDATILLLGPSGTGKTVISNYIHEHSDRSAEPFVVVHCPSLSKELLESELFGHVKGSFTGAIKDTWGKVEAADNGTLFLDEIGDLPFELQAKLLRLLQDREYERIGETKTRSANVRILAATNKDLQEAVKEGTFREDLFYRLNVISLTLPGLSKRKTDIGPLLKNYIEFFGNKLGRGNISITDEALAALDNYDWPGNLRELKNAVERSVILCKDNEISLRDLPLEIGNNGTDGESTSSLPTGMLSLQELESIHIKRVLDEAENLEAAAGILGIDTATLYRKRKKLGLLD